MVPANYANVLRYIGMGGVVLAVMIFLLHLFW